jgi:uncharacterized protein
MDSTMTGERVHAYAVYCIDRPDSAMHRKNHAAAHLAYIESIIEKILIAGPLTTGPGAATAGSLLVLKASTAAEARALVEADPYFKADFWASVDIQPFWGVAGAWVGGKTW